MATAENNYDDLLNMGETIAGLQKKLEAVSIEDPTKITFDSKLTTMHCGPACGCKGKNAFFLKKCRSIA